MVRLKEALDSGVDSGRERLHRLLSERKYIGITGLSRSGKSTFITSLINQLHNHEQAKLGAFSPWIARRIVAVKLHPLEDRALAGFPYRQAVQDLAAAPPRWPASTSDISGCLIELKLRKASPWRWQSPTRSLFIEIRDYPGEWLLDLPLMAMSFADWCGQCAHQFSQPLRAHLLGDLLPALQQLDPLAPCDEPLIATLRERYVAFLRRCKQAEHSLSLIQPGRFLIPGGAASQEALQFLPLLGCATLSPTQRETAAADSNYRVLERRYNAYLKTLVVPFYKKFLRPIDRQIVLVDLINALNGGPEYLDDMRQALSNISDSFSYGRHSPIAKLFSPKIEKVIFAATKVDQVVAKDHDNVRQLLAAIVRKALEDAAYQGAAPKPEAIAAIRSSHEIQRRGSPAITGTDLAGERVGYVHPEIPDHVPTNAEWAPFREWKIPLLSPPEGVRCDREQAIPHIRLDQVLQDIIGDLCQ